MGRPVRELCVLYETGGNVDVYQHGREVYVQRLSDGVEH